MRTLITRDIPAACRCLKKLGVKEQIREIAITSDTAKDAWSRGFDLLWGIFDLATETTGEEELYKFLSGPFEMTPQELAELPIPDLINGLKQLAADNDLKGFFSAAAELMK